MPTTTETVTYLGRCSCGQGNRVDLSAVEVRMETPHDVIVECNRLSDAGEIVGFQARMAWLDGKDEPVEYDTARLRSRLLPCSACGKNVPLRLLVAKHSDAECNEKCMGATGPSCECRCDGANHGGSHL